MNQSNVNDDNQQIRVPQQTILKEDESRCNICDSNGSGFPIFSRLNLWKYESLASGINALIKCNKCSFTMCYSCNYDLLNNTVNNMCFQRCGEPSSILEDYRKLKYEDGTNIEYQSQNDVIRRSLFDNYNKQYTHSTSAQLSQKELQLQQVNSLLQFIPQRIDSQHTTWQTDISILTRKYFNTFIRAISQMPVQIDLDHNILTCQFELPTLKETQMVRLSYSLYIEKNVEFEINKEVLCEKLTQYIREQIQLQLRLLYNQKYITFGVAQFANTFTYIKSKYEEQSEQINHTNQEQSIYSSFPQNMVQQKIQIQQNKQNDTFQLKMSVAGLGLVEQCQQCLQYYLTDDCQIQAEYPEIMQNITDLTDYQCSQTPNTKYFVQGEQITQVQNNIEVIQQIETTNSQTTDKLEILQQQSQLIAQDEYKVQPLIPYQQVQLFDNQQQSVDDSIYKRRKTEIDTEYEVQYEFDSDSDISNETNYQYDYINNREPTELLTFKFKFNVFRKLSTEQFNMIKEGKFQEITLQNLQQLTPTIKVLIDYYA